MVDVTSTDGALIAGFSHSVSTRLAQAEVIAGK